MWPLFFGLGLFVSGLIFLLDLAQKPNLLVRAAGWLPRVSSTRIESAGRWIEGLCVMWEESCVFPITLILYTLSLRNSLPSLFDLRLHLPVDSLRIFTILVWIFKCGGVLKATASVACCVRTRVSVLRRSSDLIRWKGVVWWRYQRCEGRLQLIHRCSLGFDF